MLTHLPLDDLRTSVILRRQKLLSAFHVRLCRYNVSVPEVVGLCQQSISIIPVKQERLYLKGKAEPDSKLHIVSVQENHIAMALAVIIWRYAFIVVATDKLSHALALQRGMCFQWHSSRLEAELAGGYNPVQVHEQPRIAGMSDYTIDSLRSPLPQQGSELPVFRVLQYLHVPVDIGGHATVIDIAIIIPPQFCRLVLVNKAVQDLLIRLQVVIPQPYFGLPQMPTREIRVIAYGSADIGSPETAAPPEQMPFWRSGRDLMQLVMGFQDFAHSTLSL